MWWALQVEKSVDPDIGQLSEFNLLDSEITNEVRNTNEKLCLRKTSKNAKKKKRIKESRSWQ